MTKKESETAKHSHREQAEIIEIQSDIKTIERDIALYDAKNFDKRMEAADFLGFQIMDHIEKLQQKKIRTGQLSLLKNRAEKVKTELEDIDNRLFQILRAKIQTGAYAGSRFKSLISEYIDLNLGDDQHQEEAGYDNLDIIINGLAHLRTLPEQTRDLEPEMVFYQKTPARIVFELVEKVHFTKEDVFFDLGSGLGQVAILVNLLTGIRTKGVEFEPAFCDYARDCAAGLNLSNAIFINADARDADYSEGTIFFMYTPFKGEILQQVLEILRKQSLLRKITIITYGPCSTLVALQRWLSFSTPINDNIYKLAVFNSL